MKKSDITGWQKVFGFTFIQYYKSKSAVISLIITCLLVLVSGPLISTVATSGGGVFDSLSECKIENIYIKNETDYSFDTDRFKKEKSFYEKVNFILTDESAEKMQEHLDQNAVNDIAVHMYKEDGKYKLVFYRSEGSSISVMNTGLFSEAFDSFFLDCRMKEMNLNDEATDLINKDISTSVVDIAEISDEKKEDMNEFVMMAVVIYACVIMMIVLVSSQQIAASIVQEKSSKVIETLLLSVKPLALIVGKITGMMVILLCNFVAVILSAYISLLITALINVKKISETANSALAALNTLNDSGYTVPEAAMDPGSLGISFGRIMFGIFAVIVTTLLAYLMYSVISGITGASCSSMEDLSGASTFISLATVIGVYMVMGCSMIQNEVFTKITYFFPFSGIYIVPIHYIFGKASIADLLIVWLEVTVLTVILFRFAAKIYHVLIYHKGERLKLKNLLSISKSQKGQG